jgi:hypothetical protein
VPVTVNGRCTYLHLFANWHEPVWLMAPAKVKAVRLLGQAGDLPHEIRDGRLRLPAAGTGYRVIRVEWAAAE